jgi:hypothetical protein
VKTKMGPGGAVELAGKYEELRMARGTLAGGEAAKT